MTKNPESGSPEPGSIDEALLDTANDMYRVGIFDAATYRQVTLRDAPQLPLPLTEPMTGEDIRALRQKAHLSQAAFARYLNLTVGYVSRLERNGQRPSGPVLVLLNVIKRRGIETIVHAPRVSPLDNSPPTA